MPMGPKIYDIPTLPNLRGERKVFAMLSNDTLAAFVQRDTRTVADALVQGSLLGTEVGDRVFAAIVNYPDRHAALVAHLTERGAIETAA